MKSTLVRWVRAMSLICSLGQVGNQLAHGQATSPLTVTGTVNSQLVLTKTNGTDQSWTLQGDGGTFGVVENGNTVFRIDIGAPSNCIRIASNGKTALGPAAFYNPERSLHIKADDAPAIRLEQSGFGDDPQQAFDLEASELGFNIIDVNSSNSIPFAIETGAPTNSLFMDAVGNIGVGTGTPAAPLHVVKATQEATAELLARFAVADDALGKLEVRNGSTTDGIFHPRLRGTAASQAVPLTFEGVIALDVGANPVVAYDAAKSGGGAVATRPLVVYRNNGVAKATISATGVVTATSFNPVSSRALKHDIEGLDSQEAANALRQLAPVKFIYNEDESNQKRVGFIAEDVPEVVAAPDRQSVPIMDVVALVTRVVKDQQQTIDDQKKTMEEQKKHIEEQRRINDDQRRLNEFLIKRLNDLESQVSTTK